MSTWDSFYHRVPLLFRFYSLRNGHFEAKTWAEGPHLKRQVRIEHTHTQAQLQSGSKYSNVNEGSNGECLAKKLESRFSFSISECTLQFSGHFFYRSRASNDKRPRDKLSTTFDLARPKRFHLICSDLIWAFKLLFLYIKTDRARGKFSESPMFKLRVEIRPVHFVPFKSHYLH